MPLYLKRCKPRNTTNFNQKVKMLKTFNFRYDSNYNEKQYLKTFVRCSFLLEFEQAFLCRIYFNSVYSGNNTF